MNINQNINKLLIALRMKECFYKINTFKFFSEKAQKYCTKYQVLEEFEIPEELSNGKIEFKKKYVQVLETYKKIELLQFLANEYQFIIQEGSEADGE